MEESESIDILWTSGAYINLRLALLPRVFAGDMHTVYCSYIQESYIAKGNLSAKSQRWALLKYYVGLVIGTKELGQNKAQLMLP